MYSYCPARFSKVDLYGQKLTTIKEEVLYLDIEDLKQSSVIPINNDAQRYVNSTAPKPSIEDQSPTAAVTDKEGNQPGRLEVPWDSPAPDVQVNHHAPSNFGTPPRLRRFVQ